MFGRSTSGHYVARGTVCAVLAIYFGMWYVYHVVCHPVAGWALLFNTVLALAVCSYVQTATTDPGTPNCPEWQAWAASLASTDEAGKAKLNGEGEQAERRKRQGWRPGEGSWCSECSMHRPERAHHCSQCAHCVMRLDHHCPWVGTCVGWRNHKHFLLLNWWTFWACLLWLLTLRRPDALQAIDLFAGADAKHSLTPTCAVAVAAVFMLITGCMFLHCAAMALRNVTAVEELYSGENPYALPSCLDNARQLLGPLDWRLLLPLEPTDRPSGVAFPAVAASGDGGAAAEGEGYGSCC